MKTLKKTLFLLSFVLITPQAFGIVVSDPSSYLYMVEEIEAVNNQIAAVNEGNVTSASTLTEVKSMKDKLTGSYNKTMGAIDNAKAITGRLKGVTTTMHESLNMSKNSSGKSKFKNMEDYLSKIFADPRYKNVNNPAIKNLQYNARQRAYKNTILISDKIMKGQKERLKNLDKLSAEIDNTKNVKEATDLTNRVLIEIVRLNVEMLSIQMALTEAYGLQNYTGLEESDNEKQITKMNKTPNEKGWSMKKALDKKINGRPDPFDDM